MRHNLRHGHLSRASKRMFQVRRSPPASRAPRRKPPGTVLKSYQSEPQRKSLPTGKPSPLRHPFPIRRLPLLPASRLPTQKPLLLLKRAAIQKKQTSRALNVVGHPMTRVSSDGNSQSPALTMLRKRLRPVKATRRHLPDESPRRSCRGHPPNFTGFTNMKDALIDALEAVLFDDRFPDALDYFGTHGLLTAHNMGLRPVGEETLRALILGEDTPISDSGRRTLQQANQTVGTALADALREDLPPPVPDEIYDDEDARINWCSGFLDYVDSSDAFHVDNEPLQEQIANLLVPVVTFAEEDPSSIGEKLTVQLLEQLQDNLLDLYLALHANQN
ncbi:MAG: YecA family protein [Gammaproteobacteria bacterium]|nr:MAG: YecA family protein [Gammaproteobacteria bacterium]